MKFNSGWVSILASGMTGLVPIIVGLWSISRHFTNIEIEQVHLKSQLQTVEIKISDINQRIKVVPLNSQLILIDKNELSKLSIKTSILTDKLNKLNTSLGNYVDKDYFYRDMGIIKDDFRSSNGKIYLNTREINFLRGKFDNDNDPFPK